MKNAFDAAAYLDKRVTFLQAGETLTDLDIAAIEILLAHMDEHQPPFGLHNCVFYQRMAEA
jgi:hypothetical protein